VVSGEQPSDRICHKIEILSFPSLSERGPLGSGASLLKKGEVRGEGRMERGMGKVRKALTLLMGHFEPLFLSPPPGSGSGKGQGNDLTSKQSLEFSLIRTSLARK